MSGPRLGRALEGGSGVHHSHSWGALRRAEGNEPPSRGRTGRGGGWPGRGTPERVRRGGSRGFSPKRWRGVRGGRAEPSRAVLRTGDDWFMSTARDWGSEGWERRGRGQRWPRRGRGHGHLSPLGGMGSWTPRQIWATPDKGEQERSPSELREFGEPSRAPFGNSYRELRRQSRPGSFQCSCGRRPPTPVLGPRDRLLCLALSCTPYF